MKGAARRLAAAVEALRTSGGSVAELQTQEKELVQALIVLQRLWKPELLTNPTAPKKRSAKSNAALFQLLLATLIVYSGGHTGNSSAGVAGGGTGAMGVSLTSSSTQTSECVHRLVCDLLVRSFDFSVVPSINEALMAKNSSLYVKVSLVMVVCRLPLQEALQFLPDALAIANKSIRAADYYMKQCLIESVAHTFAGDSMRLLVFHNEVLKIVNKTFQDKVPEVRIAAARLLQVVAERTSVTTVSSGSGSTGGQGGSGNGNSSGAGASSGSAPGSSTGGSSNAHGVSLDAILQITAKGMDDVAPEARRAYSVVVGVVLAKYATSSSGEAEMQAGGDASGSNVVSSRNNEEDAGSRGSIEHDTPPSSGSGKTKSGFKLHVPGINLPSSLSRRKATAVNFSTIANVVLYFKDLVTSKYLSTNPNQSHGGILASFSIALCSMFERLPPDAIAEAQLREVMDATLAILDHPFALGDLTRARNAVGFVLRYGLNGCLTERQQEVLLGAYLQKLRDESQASEPNHHKILSMLVEMSHMFHSMGEACVTNARDASDILQGLICHEKQSVRFQAAIALASLVTAIPYRLQSVLTSCLQGLRDTAEYLMRGGSDVDELTNSGSENVEDGQEEGNDMQSKTHLYAIQGRSSAIAHILRAIKLDGNGGLSQATMDDIYSISEELVESQFLNECADSIWLTCTRAGWTLVGSLVAINDDQWIKANLERLLNLWLKSSVLHSRESSLELLRIEAAVIALSSFLANYQNAAVDSNSDVNILASHVLHVYLMATQDTLSKPIKRRGQIARYRLLGWIINCFSMLPPIYSDSYIVLLDLIAEFTTAQALMNLRHSSLIPAKSTYLQSVLSYDDDTLGIVTLSRLDPGDYPSPLYSRELNHVLGLQQRENALTDTELEVQYLDTFLRSMTEKEAVDGAAKRASCSPFTYVRLVDTSVILFGRLFHSIPEDLQLRCLQHYAGALSDVRADCEVNVCSLLFAVIAEARRLEKSGAAPTSSASLSATSWPLQMQTMLCEMISSENTVVRRGAGEALGSLAVILGEDHCKGLIIELEKRLVVDKLPHGASNATFGAAADLDVSVLSAGAAFALACIKRVCGSRISIDTSLIFRFAGECSQPLRTWILHAWGIILQSVNSTGGDYEQFVNSTFLLMEAHVLAGFVYSKVNKRGLRWQISTKVALGRIINDVVATLGPELDGSTDRLNEFYSYWMLLRQDGDARVELQFLRFLEQVVVFAPSRFQAADLRYILRIISDTALLNSGTASSLPAQQNSGPQILSPPSGNGPSLTTLGNFEPFQNDLVSIGVYTNGWSRSILQTVGLSCIRTLVERDPTLIHRQNLFCLLFSALHVEYNELMWSYLPGLHGMWDVLAFAYADNTTMQRNSIAVLQSAALALLDVEGRDHESAEPCLWALLCRSIAIGESISTFAGGGAEELMMSPKGMNAGIQVPSTDTTGDDMASWSPNPALDMPKTDANSLASEAIAIQVNTWRATKAGVGDLMALMPPLSRQVRHFAVECVLRVFELMAATPPMTTDVGQNKQLHFDLIAARRYFVEMLSAGAPLPVSTDSSTGNFLCMYLDEFVTLACHVTTTSAEGDELLMFQCMGLRLLNVLVKNFASARDPEVATGDAYLLDPYRAQLSSAIRHALKQVQVENPPLTRSLDNEKGEESYFYAPLLLEAHTIAGSCVSSHLIQDKVGLGRILRAVVTPDYGHTHFIGDELTRTSLSLANLASVGDLLSSSVAEAIAQKDARDDEHRAVAVSPLVKAMTNGLSDSAEYLFKCWMDSTFAYGLVMQGSAQWAHLDTNSSAASDEVMVMPALRMPLPPIGVIPDVPTATLPTSKALSALYKRYWPKIVHAMASLEVYLPKLVSLCSTHGGNIPKWSSVLLSSAIFHVNANARDRMEDERELPAVLHSIPLLLRALTENPSTQGGSSNVFPVLLTAALNTTILASKRCSGLAQTEALKAMFSCLSHENLAFAREVCRSGEDGDRRSAALFDTVVQAGLCPTEVVCQICDTTEQTRHARAVSIGSRTTGARRSSVASVQETKRMAEIVQFATTGIVLLHTTEEARHGVVRSVALVQQAICSVAGDYYSPVVKDAVATLSRASTESVFALARTLEVNNNSTGVLFRIKSSVRSCFEFLAEWIKVDIHTAPGFSMQIVANYAVSFPSSVQDDAERFHAEIAETSAATLEHTTLTGGDGKQQHSATAELLGGLHAVVKKLVDVHQDAILNRYLVALGPSLVEIVAVSNGYPETPGELAELDEAEKLLRVLTMQLNDQHGSTFVRMLLPRLATVLSHQPSSAVDNPVPVQVPGILARLLLCFAQTHAAAFKGEVTAMSPTLRGVLETALRLTLTGSVPAAGQTSLPQTSSPSAKLDLSRYN